MGDRPIPLTILTGFLGAGKTTLLNRILAQSQDRRVAVLVNDFGAINIDAELVVGVEGGAVSLSNGCVCCSIQGELVDAINGLLERAEPPEQILLEASGVADPTAIATTFATADFGGRVALDAVVCVVDAEHFLEAREQVGLKLRQASFADLLVLNKVGEAGAEKLAGIQQWIDRYLEQPRIVETNYCAIPTELLFEPRLPRQSFSPNQGLTVSLDGLHGDHAGEHRQQHDGHPVTLSIEEARPLSLEGLQRMVAAWPAGVYRAKGIFHVVERPQTPCLLQLVGRRSQFSWLEEGEHEKPGSRLVVIAQPGSLDGTALRVAFDDCVAQSRVEVVR